MSSSALMFPLGNKWNANLVKSCFWRLKANTDVCTASKTHKKSVILPFTLGAAPWLSGHITLTHSLVIIYFPSDIYINISQYCNTCHCTAYTGFWFDYYASDTSKKNKALYFSSIWLSEEQTLYLSFIRSIYFTSVSLYLSYSALICFGPSSSPNSSHSLSHALIPPPPRLRTDITDNESQFTVKEVCLLYVYLGVWVSARVCFCQEWFKVRGREY